MRLRFYTCDVFTNARFGGNPLAVVLGGEGLKSEQMQLVAREFNYSETTFVLPPEAGHTRKVRIFTTKAELPFAGHPNIGTAFTLASIGELGDTEDGLSVSFEEKAGPVPISIRQEAGGRIRCELKAPQKLSLGQTVAPEQMAEILSLDSGDIVTSTHPPQEASVGLPFVITELRDRAALERVRVNVAELAKLESLGVRPSMFTYTHSTDTYSTDTYSTDTHSTDTHGTDDFDIRARMFAPLGGTPEDPATGSANCALVAMLTHFSEAEQGEFSWRIAQGVEMQRPSTLYARTRKEAGEVTGVWMAGDCVMVSEGTIEVG